MNTQKKKIVIIGPAFPYRGGIANFTDSLYEELIKENDVEIISFKRQYPDFLFPGKSQFEDQIEKAKIIAQNLIDSINPLNWISVGNKIKNQKPDLVIFKYWLPFFGPAFGTIAKQIKKNNHTKILTICHNVIPHEKRPGDISFTKYFVKYSDHFILLSNKVVGDLLKFVPQAKYKILPHPVYSKFGNAVSKSEAKNFLNLNYEKIILFFGLIRDYKGLDILIEAMNLLKDKIDLKLIISGEFYSGKEKYLNLIKNYELENKIQLFGNFIPTEEVKYYFSAADVVILPYKEATQSGIVQIAMNFKKPVIAANVGGLGEVVIENKTGFIVEKENPEQLAKAILKFYKENKEEEFSRNAEVEAEKYSWQKFAQGIFELTEESSSKNYKG